MKSINELVYLDNNATAPMPKEAIQAFVDWSNMGNASSSYNSATMSANMILKFKDYLLSLCKTSRDRHEVIFTSGASESNATIMKLFAAIRGKVLVSDVEHKCLRDCAERIEGCARLKCPRGKVDELDTICDSGSIDEENNIKPGSRLCVSVMSANNETGIMNDEIVLAEKIHLLGGLFHTDAAQTFGKYPPNLCLSRDLDDVHGSMVDLSTFDSTAKSKDSRARVRLSLAPDAVSLSFHKYGGMQGLGALIVTREVADLIGECPLIHGSQNKGLRGGTENVAGLAACFVAMKIYSQERPRKNMVLKKKTDYIRAFLAKEYRAMYLDEYFKSSAMVQKIPSPQIVFIANRDSVILPNTILLSVIKFTKPYVCNAKFKKALESRGVIVSIGSACNTSSDKPSYVLDAMGCDNFIKYGTLRISLGDQNTDSDIDTFLREFCKLANQIFHN